MFSRFCVVTEKFLGYSIIFLQVNNAPELIQGQFHDYCNQHGITYELTIPDASQQNGIAECTNQIIENMMHAMLVDSRLSFWFWPLAAQAAIHIKNHVPHCSLLPNTTSFEVGSSGNLTFCISGLSVHSSQQEKPTLTN